jgi:ribonuclease VapC
MVIDTSAVIAIFLDEPERLAFSRVILASTPRLMSAVSKLEAGMVALARAGQAGASRLDGILRELDLAFVPFDERQADIARDAFARYGKGRHKAALNFGDCAAYAVAVAEAEPLLFKGTDFGATDVQVVPVGGGQ